MKNPSNKIMDKAITMRLEGQSWAIVLKATQLSHSQAERHEFRFKMWLQANGVAVDGDWSPIAPTPEAIKAARLAGTSWGVIGERAGISESKARKIWGETTGVDSKGLRIGKGGRYAYGDEKLYEPNRKVGIPHPNRSGKPVLNAKGDALKGLTQEQRDALKAINMDRLRVKVEAARDRNKGATKAMKELTA